MNLLKNITYPTIAITALLLVALQPADERLVPTQALSKPDVVWIPASAGGWVPTSVPAMARSASSRV